LAGGSGIRARPITLEAPGYIRSKATMGFAGRPLIEWQLMGLQDQGINSFYIIVNGRENRSQVKDVIGHGDALGAQVRYSRSRMDRHNTGSGEATLTGIVHWGLNDLALVFPTDSLFEFDLTRMVAEHIASGALVTVATVERTAVGVAGKYGTMVVDGDGWIRRFVEKPALPEVLALSPDPMRVPINAGLYLIDCAALARLATDTGLTRLAQRQLDWGHDLLPWLTANGYPVRCSTIGKAGDLGNPRDYLETLGDVLAGGYPHLLKRMEQPYPGNIWIHESSLSQCDPVTGLSLAAKMTEGLVQIGPNVRIGRHVEIGPHAVVADAFIGDGVDLHAGSIVRRSACMDGTIVGVGARVIDSHVGIMANIESTPQTLTVVEGYSALGHEVTLRPGVRLNGVAVYPGITVPAGTFVAPGTTLTEATDLPEAA
jgi:NDP-sugar pyrophosphorylase family protein